MKGGNITFFFKGDDKDLQKKTSGISSKLGNVGKKIGTSFIAGATVAGTALVALTTKAVNSYADLEQSIGGVETLYKENADALIENANRAYKTAGMDANKYMETATSFGASLLQSLGNDTAKAVEYTDRAIIDMSDNANKMGTSIESIQNAYQGFAKQNYTMLDNLKLGYGGTKTEMQRLIEDASKMKDVQKELNVTVKDGDMSFGNIVNAISVVQSKLGIAGTTSKEASDTIRGSVSAMKSAFQNFLTGEGSVDAVVDTVVTAGKNIGQAFIKLLPKIIPGVIGIINGLLPPLLTAITEMLPTIITQLVQGLIGLIEALANILPDLLPTLVDAIVGIIPMLYEYMPLFLEAGGKLLMGLAEGLIRSIPKLIKHLPAITGHIIKFMLTLPAEFLKIGGQLIAGLWNGIKKAWEDTKKKIKDWGKGVLGYVKGMFGIHSPSTEFEFIGKMNTEGLIKGMSGMQDELQATYDGMFDLSPQLYGTASTNLSPNINVVVNNEFEQDPLGQMVQKRKTFAGGAKNDYNYGFGGA